MTDERRAHHQLQLAGEAFQRGDQRLLVDDAAARRVHDEAARRHRGEEGGVDGVAAAWIQVAVAAHDVALRGELEGRRGAPNAERLVESGRHVRVVEYDSEAERLCAQRGGRPDAAAPEDAES